MHSMLLLKPNKNMNYKEIEWMRILIVKSFSPIPIFETAYHLSEKESFYILSFSIKSYDTSLT